MVENIVASRLKLFVKIGSVIVFVLVIAGMFWHHKAFFIGAMVLLALCFSVEYQLINYQEELSQRVIIPQLEGETKQYIEFAEFMEIIGSSFFR